MEEIKNGDQPWFEGGLKFHCTGCGKCCTGSPGYVFLSDDDLARLAARFQMSPQQFAAQYTRFVDGQYTLLDRPGSDHCIFLKENKCQVYEDRPVQCKTFPWWIQNLRTPEHWKEAARSCEGINHPDAPLVPSEKIQEQCMIYLDNLGDC